MEIEVVENVTKLNDEVAQLNRASLRKSQTYAVNLLGSVGCGKTALIESTLPRLSAHGVRSAVIAGDLATRRDAERIKHATDQVVQINTGKTCHLEANHVRQAMSRLSLDVTDLLIIENVGNLICPAGFDLGEDAKVGVFSVMHGDDKVAKHPHIVMACDVLILTAIDMLPHVRFDLDLFRNDVSQLNSRAELIELSSMTGANLDRWIQWLDARLQRSE